MGVFKDSTEASQFIGRIWELLADDPDIGPKLAATNLVMRGSYTDPDYVVTIYCQAGSIKVEHGDTTTEADATLILSADTGHRFWLGAVNLPMALARGQVKAEGKMSEVMKVLPFLKPAYDIYRAHLVAAGRDDLLTK
jgi:putative sterol carrier protein